MTVLLGMDDVVATRLNKDQLETIDLLIKQGKFKNRSDAIRNLISSGLEHYLDKTNNQLQLLFGEPQMSKQELQDVSKIIFDKPISELVSEMRE